MKGPFARLCVAAMAMFFLMAATPSAAGDIAPEEFNACSQCHSGASDGWCAGLVINAVGACCGSMNQTAWAWCVNSEWGFFVRCETPQAYDCQCDAYGGDCSLINPPLLPE